MTMRALLKSGFLDDAEALPHDERGVVHANEILGRHIIQTKFKQIVFSET